MTEKREIYLITTKFNGVGMPLDAYESRDDAIEMAKAINHASGNENARIMPINLFNNVESTAEWYRTALRERNGYFNEGMERAAHIVITFVGEGDDEKVKDYAATMYNTIKANKRDL